MTNASLHQPGADPMLGKIVVAAALGAVIGSRIRFRTSLLFAGAAAIAYLRRPNPQEENSRSPFKEASDSLPSAEQVPTEVCPPSEPFILREPCEKSPPNWDELRAALIPPSTLFTPAQPPTSPLLSAAPQFVDVPEPYTPKPLLHPEAAAIIPDAVTLPPTFLPSNPSLGNADSESSSNSSLRDHHKP